MYVVIRKHFAGDITSIQIKRTMVQQSSLHGQVYIHLRPPTKLDMKLHHEIEAPLSNPHYSTGSS
jgi:hypothetical protein